MTQDLASGYMSGKLLLKLEAVAFILANHSSDNFTFLEEPGNSRARSLFYHTLARLLFMEDTPAKFKTFVAPLQQVCSRHATMTSQVWALPLPLPLPLPLLAFGQCQGCRPCVLWRRSHSAREHLILNSFFPGNLLLSSPLHMPLARGWRRGKHVVRMLPSVAHFAAHFQCSKCRLLTRAPRPRCWWR